MTGIQEILLLLILVLAIFFVPRILPRGSDKKPAQPVWIVSGKMRLAIAISLFWIILAAALLQPWKKNLMLFLYTGPGPVAFGWILSWVISGFRKQKR